MATTTITYDTGDYADMLDALRSLAVKAAGVEGATDVGAFFAIRKAGQYTSGEFSSLSEWLDDFASTLQDFLSAEGEELEGWEAA